MSNNMIHQTRHIHRKKENINRNHKIEIIKSKRVFPTFSGDRLRTPFQAGPVLRGVSIVCLSLSDTKRQGRPSRVCVPIAGFELINRIKYAAPPHRRVTRFEFYLPLDFNKRGWNGTIPIDGWMDIFWNFKPGTPFSVLLFWRTEMFFGCWLPIWGWTSGWWKGRHSWMSGRKRVD